MNTGAGLRKDTALRGMREAKKSRRLMVTLSVVGGVYCCTWAFTMTSVTLMNVLPVAPSVAFHVSLYVGWMAALNASCNAYIYCWRSREWRQEIVGKVRALVSCTRTVNGPKGIQTTLIDKATQQTLRLKRQAETKVRNICT